jgi:putative tryptophan/tyrosine transport system substrate-binding protein
VERVWIDSFTIGFKSALRNLKFAILISAMLFALCSSLEAQQPKTVFRIGYLSALDPARESTGSDAIRLALRELNYIEGQNIAFAYRYAEGKVDWLPDLAAELVRSKVDIIIAVNFQGIQAAKNATTTIPIVMVNVGRDPVEGGLIESLARPGGNVTGISNLGVELGGKRLELLKEAVSKITRVAELYDPANPGNLAGVKGLLSAARTLKLTIQPWEVRGADDFERVFSAMGKQRPDGLYVHGGPLMYTNQKRIAGFALKSRLPSIYSQKEYVHAGGLMSYGNDITEHYRRVAYYVDRILKGAKPADLPVEQPTKFEFVINLKTAKQIGLTIPQSLLYRADKVIK